MVHTYMHNCKYNMIVHPGVTMQLAKVNTKKCVATCSLDNKETV